LEYHFFDDKNAKMANDRQKELTHGTNEYLIGAEYDMNKIFTISAGAQRTDYGLSDGYEANTSFACDSYSVGAGGAVNVNKHVRINVGYFVTLYSDYTKAYKCRQPRILQHNIGRYRRLFPYKWCIWHWNRLQILITSE
jgi:long-chain fatty acid transport protein